MCHLSAGEHVRDVIGKCLQSLHAVKLLRHHGMSGKWDTSTRPRPLQAAVYALSPYSHAFIIGIPSPTHSFTLGLNPSFSSNPPYRSLSFVSFKIHYMDFQDCLLLLLSISVFLLFSFFLFLHFFKLSVPCGRLSWLMSAFERTLK